MVKTAAFEAENPGSNPGEATREFQFTYRFGGHEWVVAIFATNPAEAREKIKAVAFARYDGEIAMKIPVPMGGLIRRAWRALIRG